MFGSSMFNHPFMYGRNPYIQTRRPQYYNPYYDDEEEDETMISPHWNTTSRRTPSPPQRVVPQSSVKLFADNDDEDSEEEEEYELPQHRVQRPQQFQQRPMQHQSRPIQQNRTRPQQPAQKQMPRAHTRPQFQQATQNPRVNQNRFQQTNEIPVRHVSQLRRDIPFEEEEEIVQPQIVKKQTSPQRSTSPQDRQQSQEIKQPSPVPKPQLETQQQETPNYEAPQPTVEETTEEEKEEKQSFEQINKISGEIDDLGKQLEQLKLAGEERNISEEEKKYWFELKKTEELLIQKLLKLDGIVGSDDVRKNRKAQVLRIQNLLSEIDDMRKVENENVSESKL